MIKQVPIDPYDPEAPLEEAAAELVRQAKFGDVRDAIRFLKRKRRGRPLTEREITLPDGTKTVLVP